jgi:uncharacterized membrane protein YdjX (TVP38/TMEM64 family)
VEDLFLEFLQSTNPLLFFIISVVLNIIIAISGLLPSAFLTAANISVFGFKMGLAVSIIGEALGAILSFLLYRRGIEKLSPRFTIRNRFLRGILEKLKRTEGLGAALLVLALRILPFIPSGTVTLAAAASKMGLLSFAIFSTIGKIPALLMEAYAVDQMLGLSTDLKVISISVLLILWAVYYMFKRRRNQVEKCSR